MATTGEEILGMSDEDFLKMPVPVVEAPSEPAPSGEEPNQVVDVPLVQEPVTPEPVVQPAVVPDDKPDTVEDGSKKEGEEANADPLIEGKVADDQKAPVTEGKDGVSTPEVKADEQQTTPPNYEELYKALMAPLKANGKTIEIRDPKELIQLAQQGANYTRKMQELAPKRKLLMMLENNGLDEDQLSFFLDLKNKNPEAIKKLLKDSNIDPMDLDTSVEPAYKQGNHRVSDAEATFQSTLDDVRSTEDGQKTLQAIHSTWDQASKEALWDNPQVMQIMHEQRMTGVYDRISGEVDRQRTLGIIPANLPFLQAYKTVGDQMVAENKFADLVEKQTPTPQTPATPVATRTAAPKAAVVNNEKARAASATQAAPRNANAQVNFLAMSDEEFMKQAAKVRL